MKSPPDENTQALAAIARECGMAVFGVADLDPIRETFRPEISAMAQNLKYGIAMGYRLSDPILDGIENLPTLLYKHHYKVANYVLDQAAGRVAAFIHRAGHQALPVPASQVIDWKNNFGHLSHKAVAVQAGLGWIGRSALFIHTEHHTRLRLVTVLTDLPLVAGSPMDRKDHCGICRRCINACPGGAITEAGYDKQKCAETLKVFSKMPGIGQSICGVCVKVCRGGV